jgi:hypothetical protein
VRDFLSGAFRSADGLRRPVAGTERSRVTAHVEKTAHVRPRHKPPGPVVALAGERPAVWRIPSKTGAHARKANPSRPAASHITTRRYDDELTKSPLILAGWLSRSHSASSGLGALRNPTLCILAPSASTPLCRLGGMTGEHLASRTYSLNCGPYDWKRWRGNILERAAFRSQRRRLWVGKTALILDRR